MKLFIISSIIQFVLIIATNFNSESDVHEFSLRYKSIKCLVADPSKVKMNFCYIKAHSRKLTSINVGLELYENYEFPSKVC